MADMGGPSNGTALPGVYAAPLLPGEYHDAAIGMGDAQPMYSTVGMCDAEEEVTGFGPAGSDLGRSHSLATTAPGAYASLDPDHEVYRSLGDRTIEAANFREASDA